MILYRLLLLLYPRAFRNEYGAEMTRVTARRLRDAGSFPARALAWFAILGDLLASAAAAHFDYLRQDLRYAARTLRRAPGFALTVVLVTALGVGANVATFAVVDHAMLRPLALPDPERLVMLWQAHPGYPRMELSPPNFKDWSAATASFSGLAAWSTFAANLTGQGEPRRIETTLTTTNLFGMLGVRPTLGRDFLPGDQSPAAPGVAILSHRLWVTQFASDPAIVGQTIRLDGKPHTVTGVMPADFAFPRRTIDLWTPLRMDPDDAADRNNNFLIAAGRLKPGVTLAQAREEFRVLTARLALAYPKENQGVGAFLHPMGDQTGERTRLTLWTLFGASLCVLLIAVVNLANLLVTRALARRRELAVRASLGAGTERLVRQLLTENLLLSALGGLGGVAAAYAALPLLARLAPPGIPAPPPALDLRVLAFAVGLTVLTALAFGLGPAIAACRGLESDHLREGARAGLGGRREGLRQTLVAIEVAVSVVLLASAGLLLRALARIESVDPGFRTANVLTLRTPLAMPAYGETARRETFYNQVLAEVRALPGVTEAGFTTFLPLVMGGGIWPVEIAGQTSNRSENHSASYRVVTPGFFGALGIPLKLGRGFGPLDAPGAPVAAIVSESFVRRYWPSADPLGRRFQMAFAERTVVGVVADIRVRGLEASSEPQVYALSRQMRDNALVFYAPKDLAIRTERPPEALTAAVRDIIRRADPDTPVTAVQTLERVVEDSSAARRLQVRIVAAFAGLAFLLAAVGIYGLLAFAVSQRMPEFAVRMALGANPGDILGLVLRQGSVPALLGVAGGAVGAVAAARSFAALLAGVSPADPRTLAAAVGLALVMVAAGSVTPALRATRVDPARVIRAE